MKPKIAFITSGGTISGKSNDNKYGIRPVLTGEQILSCSPHLNDIVDFEIKDLCAIDSSDVTLEDWTKFGKAIFPYLQRDDVSGIIFTFGTDTLEFTSPALALMLRNLNKPVAVLATMTTIDQNKAHVQRHLEDSVLAVTESGINEVILCFSADKNSTYTNVYRAMNIFKYSSGNNNAFRCVYGEQPIALVKNGKIHFLNGYVSPAYSKPPFLIPEFSRDIYHIRDILSPSAFDDHNRVIEKYGIKGILFQITDNKIGEHPERYEFIKKHLQEGRPVAIISNTLEKHLPNLDLSASEKDRELEQMGAIPLGRMRFPQAITKLGWVISQTNADILKTKELMLHNYAGEMLPANYK